MALLGKICPDFRSVIIAIRSNKPASSIKPTGSMVVTIIHSRKLIAPVISKEAKAVNRVATTKSFRPVTANPSPFESPLAAVQGNDSSSLN